MRIIHISDVHIRNLKYHQEYRRVFQNLYQKIRELKPDIVVNTGDTAHTKTQISPEFVEMASEHMRQVADLAPYHMILGNHDLNLMNPDRQDAITPIVESINNPQIFLHKKSGRVSLTDKNGQNVNLWIFSLADTENYPLPSHWAAHPDAINIGLFHGSVSTCVTDSNWRMTHVEHDLSIFDGLDYALLGDIHKQQFFNDRRIAYAGSLIQQNFGEELDKGFLVWDIKDKDNFDVSSVFLTGSRKFYTVKIPEDLSIPDLDIEDGAHLRISPMRSITLVEQKEIEKLVKKQYKPHDVITLSATNIGVQQAQAGKKLVDIENLRLVEVQEKLIREFLKDRNLPDSVLNKILELNRKYQIHVDQKDDTARNVSWQLEKLGWNNLFNYGENNVIDFGQLGGLTGLFAPNASGKSNFIDIIAETCFDATTKGINKNIFIINDNKDIANSIATVTVNNQPYLIERNIERIKYGQRSSDKLKEWGKTTVSFALVDEMGGVEPLVGTTRPETERNIRQRLGTFDDFMLTSLLAQWNPMDIIACKETKRKEIIYKFLDLDIFGQKCLLAKDESKEYVSRLSDLEDNGIEENVKRYRTSISLREHSLEEKHVEHSDLEKLIVELDQKLVSLTEQRVQVEKRDLLDWAGKIKKTDADVEANAQKLRELEFKLVEKDEELAKISKLEQRFDLKLHEEKSSRHAEVTSELLVTATRISEKKQNLTNHKKNSSLLGQVPCGDQFPTCKFLVNAFDSRKKIPTLEEEIANLEKERDALLAEQESLLSFKEKLDKYRKFTGEKSNIEARRDNLKLQVENVKLKLSNLEETKKKILQEKSHFEKMEAAIKFNAEIEQQIDGTMNEKIIVTKKIKTVQKEIQELNRDLGSDQGIVNKLAAQLAQIQELRDLCTAYEHYIDAMGKDGIAYQILTQKLPLINEEINKILANAADFSVFIEHDHDEQSIRFYLQYSEYKSRLLELGSGAEKFLASIAIRNALLNISNLPKPNMFIIDEGFGKLDPKNLEAVQRMFDYLKSVFDHVIVISHLDTMKDMVDNIIDITTDPEGYAHIEIGS